MNLWIPYTLQKCSQGSRLKLHLWQRKTVQAGATPEDGQSPGQILQILFLGSGCKPAPRGSRMLIRAKGFGHVPGFSSIWWHRVAYDILWAPRKSKPCYLLETQLAFPTSNQFTFGKPIYICLVFKGTLATWIPARTHTPKPENANSWIPNPPLNPESPKTP